MKSRAIAFSLFALAACGGAQDEPRPSSTAADTAETTEAPARNSAGDVVSAPIPDDAAHLACIQAALPISNIQISDVERNDMLRFVTITFDVTNDLDFAISGFAYDVEVSAQPLNGATFYNDRALRDVPGLAQPGDTITATTSAALPRDVEPPFDTDFAIVNVADAERRPLIEDSFLSGWAEEPSSESCTD